MILQNIFQVKIIAKRCNWICETLVYISKINHTLSLWSNWPILTISYIQNQLLNLDTFLSVKSTKNIAATACSAEICTLSAREAHAWTAVETSCCLARSCGNSSCWWEWCLTSKNIAVTACTAEISTLSAREAHAWTAVGTSCCWSSGRWIWGCHSHCCLTCCCI